MKIFHHRLTRVAVIWIIKKKTLNKALQMWYLMFIIIIKILSNIMVSVDAIDQ